MTATPSSPLAQMADKVLFIPGGPEHMPDSIQWAGYPFEHALFMLNDTLIWRLCETIGATEDTMESNHANIE